LPGGEARQRLDLDDAHVPKASRFRLRVQVTFPHTGPGESHHVASAAGGLRARARLRQPRCRGPTAPRGRACGVGRGETRR
jgi:hypothetical protein